MMGFVDLHGRALVEIHVRASDIAARHDIEAWIDTGFTGDLVLPQQMIDDLELPASGTVKAALADGSVVTLERYHCLVDWFGSERELEVVANAGERLRYRHSGSAACSPLRFSTLKRCSRLFAGLKDRKFFIQASNQLTDTRLCKTLVTNRMLLLQFDQPLLKHAKL